MTKATVKATAPKAPRKSSKKKAEQTELVLNMSTEIALDVGTGDPALDALMAELNGVGLPADDEVVLPAEPESELSIESAAADEDVLSAAVSGAEMLESYDKDAAAADAPVDATEPKAAEESAPKKARAKKEPKESKEPKAPRVFYGLDKVRRLTDRGVAAVMLKSDELLTGDDLAAAQQRTLDVVAKANQKVKNRASNILEFVTGKTNVLNNLIRVCFNLIEKDGALTTGEKGNMWATMSVCYGAGTIRSGGNNSVAALRDLQIIVQNGKGEYVRNPESALYERIAARLAAGSAESVPVAEESLEVPELEVVTPTGTAESMA